MMSAFPLRSASMSVNFRGQCHVSKQVPCIVIGRIGRRNITQILCTHMPYVPKEKCIKHLYIILF